MLSDQALGLQEGWQQRILLVDEALMLCRRHTGWPPKPRAAQRRRCCRRRRRWQAACLQIPRAGLAVMVQSMRLKGSSARNDKK